MSDLQLGLIVIGAVVIIAVFAFNRWQERQLRRRVEDTFASIAQEPPADVEDHSQTERIEPTMDRLAGDDDVPNAAPARAVETGAHAVPPAVSAADAAAQSPIDYVCTIRSAMPIPNERLHEFLRAATVVGKRVTLQAWMPEILQWVELPLKEPRAITEVHASLQLAD